MPQARDNRIPSAHSGLSSQRATRDQKTRHQISDKKKSQDGADAPKEGQHKQQVTSQARPSPERLGVFSFDWRWQLAGLIAAIVSGIALMGFSFHPELSSLPVAAFLSGMGLLMLSVYCAVKTNWLREASTAPLAVKMGTGTAIICGLIPIGAFILWAAAAIACMALMIIAIGGFLAGADSSGK